MTTTLADHLRSLPDDALAALLALRPDLVIPVPADISALAARAQSRVSVARALDGLDRFTLQILDAARLGRDPDQDTTSTEAVLALATAGPDTDRDNARRALDRLRALFLLYGPEPALRIVAGVDEVCSPHPAGLGRPAAQLAEPAAALCADPARLRRTLLSAPPAARAILDRLAAGPPVGTLAAGALDTPAEPGEAPSPVRWLVENALLAPVPDADSAAGPTVELPREVALLLRREHGPLGRLEPHPPVLAAPARDPKLADSAGAGQAMEVVRQTEALLDHLAAEPAPVLRSGGMGVRELRRLARGVGLDETTAALLLEVAYAAGLTGELDLPGSGARAGGDQQIIPTSGYELWRSSSLAQRWVQLARAWLAMTRQVGLIGQRDDRGRPINALSPDVERAGVPATRRAVLEVLDELAAGIAPGVDQVLALLAWRAPRRTRGREAAQREALAEAGLLGVTALGALTSYGRLLLADPEEGGRADPFGTGGEDDRGPAEATDPVRALDALLPAPVDHFLVQADLTVVVPGPAEPILAAELDVVAEHESAGGASVHRVTGQSLRRALDAGYTTDELHALFTRRSRTPVPQALTYLIDDVGRRHGGLRAGPAGAYLRSDDEALLAEVLADRRLAGLALRRLAPTVLVTPQQVGRLLNALREVGYAPVPEDSGGGTVLTRPRARRAPAKLSAAVARVTDPLAAPKLSRPRILGIVEQIRRGDAAARAVRRVPTGVRGAVGPAGAGRPGRQEHGEALAVLQQAVRDRARVWVGYVDAHGSTASRLVRPVSIGAGYLRAEDERTEMLHTFVLHRITTAVLDV